MAEIGSADLTLARQLVERAAGIDVPIERENDLANAVRGRARAAGARDPRSYLARLAAHPVSARAEIHRLAEALAVHETYFFRDRRQLDAIVDSVIPARAREERPVRVLSAGSSTGAELYSIAILLSDRRPDLLPMIDLAGVDLSHHAVAAAQRGRYLPWALREAPPELVSRFFHARGHARELRDDIRAMASFAVQNLVGEDEGFWAPGAFDVILCRNVLMYLSRRASEALIARLERSLAPSGSLYLGHAETLRGFDTRLVAHHEGGACVYRRPVAPLPRRAEARASSPRAAPRVPRPPPSAPRGSLERVKRDRPGFVQRALALLDRGELGPAEEACARAAEVDELDPAPRYLRALCRDRAGDLEGAIRHHTAAAYLDPTFAMPCLHLALLGRRAGDRRAARRELERALVLVAQEDEARIVLFGGGLDRDALMRIMSAELSRERDAR